MELRKEHLFCTQHSIITLKHSRGYRGFQNIRGDMPTISTSETKSGMERGIGVTSLEGKIGFKNRKND
jgi:hypothetical protein